jgi:hypothetical protein
MSEETRFNDAIAIVGLGRVTFNCFLLELIADSPRLSTARGVFIALKIMEPYHCWRFCAE